ncbi:MAG: muramoyltetrapeptide carboxypeptidase [Fimbriimonadaceae bacterium]|jgi:muramoyltetrapeptide carboxypeptidase|nr:muramoyltetrapeptide carboxypeptidase [Fimbriimonadaceae bacterium]
MIPAVASQIARKPRALRKGSRVRFVSPASPMKEEKLGRMTELLESEGYVVERSKNILASDFHLAGTDEQRAADLMDAFLDPAVDAILCTRGGYGCARLMPLLDLDKMAASGKLFVGFSDITTVHIALNRRGLPTIYAPMAVTFTVDREPWVIESFKRALRGEISTPDGVPPGETLVPGQAEGEVTGGCLCLITDSLATPDSIDCEGKIVLMEDVDEHPHRIDAMLTHLLNAGEIQKAAGIVVGEMTGTDDKPDEAIGGKPWRAIVDERLRPLGIPSIVNFPFGHAKNMLSLPLGVKARLDAVAGTLTYLESPCA